MRNEKLLMFAGLCGILVPIIAIPSIGLAISNAPWFIWNYHCLSDLGVTGISSILFNYGIMLTGVLAFIFGIFLQKAIPATKLSILGVIIFILSAIALVGVGMFPVTAGDIHLYSSVSFFVLISVAMLIIGIAIIKSALSLGLFTIMLAFISPCTFFIPWPGMSCAIAEMIAIIPVIVFTTLFGVRMIFYNKFNAM